jgi:hypothetical protein
MVPEEETEMNAMTSTFFYFTPFARLIGSYRNRNRRFAGDGDYDYELRLRLRDLRTLMLRER